MEGRGDHTLVTQIPPPPPPSSSKLSTPPSSLPSMLAQRILATHSSLRSLSPFELLDHPILERIAFYLAADPFTGPPSQLIPLLSTSRTINHSLRFRSDSHLYSQIFCHKFDSAAALRRLPWDAPLLIAWPQELRKRSTTLSRMRHWNSQNLGYLHDDLWTVYLMMLENDCKNIAQLHWAQLPTWLAEVIEHKYQLPQQHPSSCFNDTEGTSLALWLLWMCSDEETVRCEDPYARNKSLERLQPFLIQGYEFSSTYAPDTYFYLPLCTELDADVPCTTGPPLPIVRDIVHYGRVLRFAAPPLVPAALLNYMVRMEARLGSNPLPPAVARLPATRAEADALGLYPPLLTQEDVVFGDYDGLESERLDSEWFKLVSCHTMWAVDRPLRGVFYHLGTLSGHWNGRALIPDVLAHVEANLPNRQHNVQNVSWALERISCVLQEHHCLVPGDHMPAPAQDHGWGEDVLNVWLPRRLRIEHEADGLILHDPETEKTVRYETYHPEHENHYSIPFRASSEWRCDSPLPVVSEDAQHDGADDYEDLCEEISSGVTDIIITGETHERKVQLGYLFFHRPSTTLGRLCRPTANSDASCPFLQWPLDIQRLHTRTQLVGRWRETGTAVDHIGYEGGFVLCKVDKVDDISVDQAA